MDKRKGKEEWKKEEERKEEKKWSENLSLTARS